MKKAIFPLLLFALFACNKQTEFIECNVWLIQHDDTQKKGESYIASSADEAQIMCEDYASKYAAICSIYCDCE